MHGMANGMILAVNCIEQNKEPEFLKAPDVWLKDINLEIQALKKES